MAYIAITENFNDTAGPTIPGGSDPLPAGSNPLPATGGEINAAVVTDDHFDDTTIKKPYGRTGTSGTEARFLQRRLLGLC
tara:strand:- start:90 stop:329 length:240 start_codon:yes stop_codon:yes gene_type:complete